MKIKITEDQAKRLNLINEDVNPLTQYEAFCKQMIEKVNKVYLHVTAISIAEILNNQVNMEEINSQLDKIESEVYNGSRRAYQYIANLPEDTDLDIRIDNANSLVMDKLTPLQLITMDLEKIQLSIEQHDITGPFKDVKPMDISDMQS